MSEQGKPVAGTVVWHDLTVKNAEKVRDFYCEVVGWKHSAVEMSGYEDFNMHEPVGNEVVAGICHARGTNAEIPPQWMVYFAVPDVDRSATRCESLGGEVIVKPRPVGSHGKFCVIRDPAGAVAALFSPPDE